ncbi:hypothetical protein NHX12_028559 [Muraenolepis orangiensis]|uniref:Ral guanine nucleotide dissociation stimulator-like 1 n=1 Tax=Muraenolepis orangiensis TaxID=630683 RepID=A0A9Q0ECD7_9TELE|nr:hypothetical protein NHX12_028559 [Muraenolepis orangiensis]
MVCTPDGAQCGGVRRHPAMFEGSRRTRSLWGGACLELSGGEEPGGRVVLQSFTHLDPDLPRGAQSSTQEIGEEEEDGAVFAITLRKVQLHQSASKGQRWLGVDSDSALSLYETCKVRTIRAGTLERLVEYMVKAFRGKDSSYVTIFLCTYRSFSSTRQVLDLLLNRYAKLPSLPVMAAHRVCQDDCTELRNTLRTSGRLQTTAHFPGSDLERRAHNLLAHFHRRQHTEHDPDAEHTGCPFATQEESGFEDELPVLSFLSFDPIMVAEQFTLMDARDKKGKEHVAPTIRATVAQFNSVTNCVISTLLSSPLLKAGQRARLLERWVEVARECRILKNFSSLRAILSALQCNAIHRLKRTWEELSRENFRTFRELSEIFSDDNNYSLSRELLVKEGTSKFATLELNPKRTQRRHQQQRELGVMQGTIPYLGTFLTDLVMMDTAMKDYTEGGLINFEKRRKEFEVIAQIKLLQLASNNYSFTPDGHFRDWFSSVERLSEAESYNLSCEIEPLSESASNTLRAKKNGGIIKRWSE